MLSISVGVFLVAMATLMLELTLIRVFDVLWYANWAYMVITLAMFAFGMAGVIASLQRSNKPQSTVAITVLSLLLGVLGWGILPFLNNSNVNLDLSSDSPISMLGNSLITVAALALPFLVSGLILSKVFSNYSANIQRLYAWDLVGAALGCTLIIPLLPRIGPGGILFMICALSVLASAAFAKNKLWKIVATVCGIVIFVAPWVKPDGYFEFKPHVDKRGFMSAMNSGRHEHSYWDPISKIDVFNMGGYKWIAYDGGTQSSHMIPFDGDFDALRASLPDAVREHFYGPHVVVSHYLKQDTDQETLVIGSAGGQETKAALTFGSKSVDSIELVGAVVSLLKTKYAKYMGDLANHPKVNMQRGEGRSFLRSSDKQYDVIQMMSNHTSSSIAAGTGAMQTTYLQTAEAYEEYFTHLKDDGILHINHHVYPKMVAIAALAWKRLGRTNFQDHVLVTEIQGGQDNLPTMLINMQPWTAEEVEKVRQFLNPALMVVDPFDKEGSYLSKEFFTGDFPEDIEESSLYRLTPSTDNTPFFNMLRKEVSVMNPDNKTFLNLSTASLLNSQMQGGYPMDIMHLIVSGGAALIFAVLFLFVPMLFSETGRERWEGKTSYLTYFACLGAGFIILELIFIHIYMRLIGFPLYTYSLTVFTFLLGAGLGSHWSEKLRIHRKSLAIVPFAGIAVFASLNLLLNEPVTNMFLQSSVWVRMFVGFIMMLPLTFFLGMPFPLGVLAVRHKGSSAIAWAWAFNALFTVIGGILSVLLAIYFGFRETVIVAILIYALAFVCYRKVRGTTEESDASRENELGVATAAA